MRAVALLIWLFLNLGFFGMCGYIYLIWAQTWRKPGVYDDLTVKSSYNPKDPVIFYETKSINTVRNEIVSKRVAQTPRTNMKKSRRRKCLGKECRRANNNKLLALKNDILLQLRRVLHDESSVFKTDNPYHVSYKGPRASLAGRPAEELLCSLKEAELRPLSRADPPFNNLPIGELIGEGNLFEGEIFQSCAIVTNAGSLLESNSGAAIDNHDIVVRFNHAPTVDYEQDVGTKTDIRIVNSQVVTKDEFAFTSNDLFKNITVIVWDPSDYSATLQQWYEKPDFDFFREWSRFRQNNPQSSSVILDPRSVWRVWDYLQSYTALRIRRNPPSSGFLGLTLMLSYCSYVDVYEYVPSSRMTSKCHYFDDLEDSSCTLGVWHPLAAEKFIALAMNHLNDSLTFEKGFIRVRGFRNLVC